MAYQGKVKLKIGLALLFKIGSLNRNLGLTFNKSANCTQYSRFESMLVARELEEKGVFH